MLKRTKIALAASALMLALATPAIAGEGSPDITDNWNNPRGYSGSTSNNGWAWQQPGVTFSVPADDDDDDGYTTGYAPRSTLDDDDDDQ